MTKIDVLGIVIRRNVEWDRTFCIMGFGDINLPHLETTLRGCALARSGGRIVALPPKVPGAHPGDLGAIQWNVRGKFATRVKDALLAAYQKMDGEMPPEPTKPKRQFVPLHELGLPDDATRGEIGAVLDKLSEERGVTCFTSRYEKPPVAPIETQHPRLRAAAEREAAEAATADDDTTGLHRVLGVDAVAETMERAGL